MKSWLFKLRSIKGRTNLSLVSIVYFVVASICLYLFVNAISSWKYSGVHSIHDFIADFSISFTQVILPPFTALLGIVFAIIGGICFLLVKNWRLAFISSIFTIIAPITYGVVSLIWIDRQLSFIGIILGITTIVLTLLLKRYFVGLVISK